MWSMPPSLAGAVTHVRPRPARSMVLSVYAPTVSSGNSPDRVSGAGDDVRERCFIAAARHARQHSRATGVPDDVDRAAPACTHSRTPVAFLARRPCRRFSLRVQTLPTLPESVLALDRRGVIDRAWLQRGGIASDDACSASIPFTLVEVPRDSCALRRSGNADSTRQFNDTDLLSVGESVQIEPRWLYEPRLAPGGGSIWLRLGKEVASTRCWLVAVPDQ